MSDYNPTSSATNYNLELVWLLAGLESKSKFIANLNLNNIDLVQTLINLVGKKVVYTHPNRGRQSGMFLCVNEETLGLWIVDDSTKQIVYVEYGKVQLSHSGEKDEAEAKMSAKLESNSQGENLTDKWSNWENAKLKLNSDGDSISKKDQPSELFQRIINNHCLLYSEMY